jgi:N-acetylglucosaminyldiphosphoundecaprenol N-acetyl-beta-D-mannosaminyltransferase
MTAATQNGGGALRRPVLGIPLYAGPSRQAGDLVLERALSGAGGYACLCGAHGLTLARRHPEFRKALESGWLNFPDGAPAAWRQYVGGVREARRVAGPDLMPLVVELGQARGVRHFLLGSTPSVLSRLQAHLLHAYPGVRIAGTLSPPFRHMTDLEEAELVQQICATSPHIVWVGLGTPKQDLWMYRNAPRLAPALAVGVGAAFDFLSGNKKRAPGWMRNAGLEWLHRMGSEPRRLAPRYLDTNARFLFYNVQEAVRERRRPREDASV